MTEFKPQLCYLFAMCLGQLILPLSVPYLPQRADGRLHCKQHICSLNKCLRGTQHVPGTVLGTVDTAVNKTKSLPSKSSPCGGWKLTVR